MSELAGKFTIDLSEVRGSFAEVGRLKTAISGRMPNPLQGQARQARNAAGQFQAVSKSVNQTSSELAQARSKSAAFFAGVGRAGRVAASIGGITVALVALNRKFPVIGQVASQAFGLVKKEGGDAAKAVTSFFGKLVANTPKAAKAALAIHGVVAAFRALKGAPKPPDVKFPKPGGRGGVAGFMGKAIAPLAIAGGIGLLGAGLFGQVKDGLSTAIKSAAQEEQIEISFEVLTGGLAPAKKAIEDIRALTEKTPLKFVDVAGAGRKLLAFGTQADQLPKTLQRIGDISSAIQAPIGEIAEIYGKARVQGTLFAEDINQLTGRGIPVLTEFANILGTTPDKIKKMASEGQITFPVLEKAFENLTGKGGQFFGMMDKQSQSINGLLSTLQDRVRNAFTAFGKPVNDAIRPMLQQAVELAGQLKERAAAWGESVAKGIDMIRAAVQTLSGGDAFKVFRLGLQLAIQEGVDLLYRGVAAVVKSLRDAEFLGGLDSKFDEIGFKLRDVLLHAVQKVFESMSEFRLVGEKFSQAADKLRAGREADASLRAQSEAIRNFGSPRDVNLGKIVEDNFKGTKGIFGTSNQALKDQLKEVMKPVEDRAKEITAERRREREEEKREARQKRDGLITPSSSAGGVAGAFQRAVNLIQGGTVNEIVAEETKKTNALLDAVKGQAERTAKAAEETARNTKGKPKVEVEVVPTFGGSTS